MGRLGQEALGAPTKNSRVQYPVPLDPAAGSYSTDLIAPALYASKTPSPFLFLQQSPESTSRALIIILPLDCNAELKIVQTARVISG